MKKEIKRIVTYHIEREELEKMIREHFDGAPTKCGTTSVLKDNAEISLLVEMPGSMNGGLPMYTNIKHILKVKIENVYEDEKIKKPSN